jgi:hypothetical protein
MEHYVNEICSEIKNFCPEALIEVSKEPYEDEDANIKVIMPDGVEWWDFFVDISAKTAEISAKEGYDILVLMYSEYGKVASKKG